LIPFRERRDGSKRSGTTHLLIADESRTNFAASPIESAIQRLRERIDLVGIITKKRKLA